MELLAPRSVVDVGCGTGSWLAAFQKRGVSEILGLDGAWVDPEWLEVSPDQRIVADLKEPIRLDRRFDLVLCLEAAENIAETSAEVLVESLVGLGPAVLFSSAVPCQGGHYHVNEQWPEYWATRFRTHGYVALDCIRPRVWSDERVAWWYSQNAVLYLKRGFVAPSAALARELERPAEPVLSLVHPRNYLEKVDPGRASFRWILRDARAWLFHRAR